MGPEGRPAKRGRGGMRKIFSPDFRAWYSEVHLGRTSASAIGENHRLAEGSGGYFICAQVVDCGLAAYGVGPPTLQDGGVRYGVAR
jgi:hypothetical protein